MLVSEVSNKHATSWLLGCLERSSAIQLGLLIFCFSSIQDYKAWGEYIQSRWQNVTWTTSNRAPCWNLTSWAPTVHILPSTLALYSPTRVTHCALLTAFYRFLICSSKLYHSPPENKFQKPTDNMVMFTTDSPTLWYQLHRLFTCLRAMTKHLTTIT